MVKAKKKNKKRKENYGYRIKWKVKWICKIIENKLESEKSRMNNVIGILMSQWEELKDIVYTW